MDDRKDGQRTNEDDVTVDRTYAQMTEDDDAGTNGRRRDISICIYTYGRFSFVRVQ